MKAEYLSHYLTDQDVANFARQSFAKLADQYTETENNNLVKFLARGVASDKWEELIQEMLDLGASDHQRAKDLATHIRSIPEHWAPFGHPHITLRMQAPVPIRVQCFKHKIGFVESEESRRYIRSRPELYVPAEFRAAAASVKQGSGERHPDSEAWRALYTRKCNDMIDAYSNAIESGICPEQARFFLPQGCEVNWVWTGSLYAYANFYNQRSESHAQKEIQELAYSINGIITLLFPVSWPALTQGCY